MRIFGIGPRALRIAMLICLFAAMPWAASCDGDSSSSDAGASNDDDQGDDADDATGDDVTTLDDADDGVSGGPKDMPTMYRTFASHDAIGWVLGEEDGKPRIWRDHHGVWSEEDVPLEPSPSVSRLYDVAAIDDERAVAVGSYYRLGIESALFMQRDENGWSPWLPSESVCDVLSIVAVSAPDDGIALCREANQYIGYRFDGTDWTPIPNPLSPWEDFPTSAWLTVVASGPGSYVFLAAAWLWDPQSAIYIFLRLTGQRVRVISADLDFYDPIWEIGAADDELFVVTCAYFDNYPCEILRRSGADWISEGTITDPVTEFSRSPGGQWYASVSEGHGKSILRHIGARWIPLLDVTGVDPVDLGYFGDIDAPRDDLVVAVGGVNTDRPRSAAAVFDGTSWRAVDALTGFKSLYLQAVSYVR